MRALPPLAIGLAVAGIIPFALLGIFSVQPGEGYSIAAMRSLVGYGAVILAFLGGVHWGFTLDEDGDGRAMRARLGLGVVPSLVGWAAILCSVFARPAVGLVVIIAGLIGTVVVESRARKRDLMPHGYMTLRWVISVVVVAILTTVLVLRVIGAHVLI